MWVEEKVEYSTVVMDRAEGAEERDDIEAVDSVAKDAIDESSW